MIDEGDDDAVLSVVAKLSREDLKRLAVIYLLGEVSSRSRRIVLGVEREAQQRPVSLVNHRRLTRKRDEQYAREDAERARKHGEELRGLIESYGEQLRVEWTTELLDSPFALADGTLVTWGDATVSQHEERRDMFTTNAYANIEGAARHGRAIQELTSAGISRLNELKVAA